MRLVDINVDGFGQFHGAHLAPAPGLTIIKGPNEAGKTTFLAFIRAMLFGFERDRYPAINGGRRGGWLNVEMADGRPFRIERYGDKGGGGKLSIQDEHHQELGEGALATLLQGVESGVYRNIFAFGLEELTQFRSLTDAEVAARIYGAGLGTGSVSGLDVEGGLAGEMEALFKPGGQLPRINKLLRELEELDAQLRDRDLPADYAAAGARLAEVERRLEELGATYADASALRRARQRVIDGWPAWLELRAARTDREAIGETRAFPADTLERLSRLETALTAADETARNAEAARDQASLKVDAAVLDEAALARRQELQDLVEVAGAETARQDERTRTELELAQARTQVDTAVARLGSGWTVERVEAFDNSVSVHSDMAGRLRTMLDRAAEAEATARRELKAAEDRIAELTGQVDDAAARMSTLETELAARLPYPTRERALQQVRGLADRLDEQRRIAADAPEADLGAERTRLEQRTRDARELAAALETREHHLRAPHQRLGHGRGDRRATVGAIRAPGRHRHRRARRRRGPAPGERVPGRGHRHRGRVLSPSPGCWPTCAGPTGVADVERVRGQLEEQLAAADASIARLGPALDLGGEPTAADVDRLLATLDDERRVLEGEEARRDRAIAATQEVERLTAEVATVARGRGPAGRTEPDRPGGLRRGHRGRPREGQPADGPAGAGVGTAGHAGDGRDPQGRARDGRRASARRRPPPPAPPGRSGSALTTWTPRTIARPPPGSSTP